MNFSIFPNIWTTASHTIVSFEQLRELIASTEMKSKIDALRSASDEKQRQFIKSSLPNITVNGVFPHRCDDGITIYNQVTALDFDHIPTSEMLQVSEMLIRNPLTHYLFTSPSGNGYKVLVKHDNMHPELHWNLYAQLLQVFGNIPYTDKGVHDLSRATFLSYDGESYFNPLSECFHFEYAPNITQQTKINKSITTKGKQGVSPMTQNMVMMNSLFQATWKDKTLMDYIDKYSWSKHPEDYMVGNRNNSLIKKATILCLCGVHYDAALWKLTYFYTRDPAIAVSESDIEKRVLYAYHNNAARFGTERQKWIDFRNKRKYPNI